MHSLHKTIIKNNWVEARKHFGNFSVFVKDNRKIFFDKDTQTIYFNKDVLIKGLINRYNNDILYDAHSTEAKISRSEARKQLQKIGKRSLKLIAKNLETLFPNNEKVDYDLFMAWIRLINGIIKDHNLPQPPYGPNIKYGNQSVEKWILYCNRKKLN
jgi:hypothetical protein